jgi:hypothetical protein
VLHLLETLLAKQQLQTTLLLTLVNFFYTFIWGLEVYPPPFFFSYGFHNY